MAYKFPPFTKIVGNSLVYNGEGTFCFFVPSKYFDRSNAKQEGEIVKLFGLVDWTIYKNGKNSGLHRFKLPALFDTRPTKMSTLRNTKLLPESTPEDYTLFEYEKGAPIFVNIEISQDVTNIEEFFKIIKAGRLPVTIEYSKIQEYFYDAFVYAGTKFSLHSQLIGAFASRYFRDPNNLQRAFRETEMSSDIGYKIINIADLPKYVSPYASITSENWMNSVVGALTNTDGNKSPLEKMLMEAAGIGSL